MPTKSSSRKVMRTKPARRKKTVDFSGFYEVAKKIGRIRVFDQTVSCPDGTMSHVGSSSPESRLIYTSKLPYGGTQTYVQFISDPFEFGLGVGMASTATPTGISFSGETLVCVGDWVCTNGQKRVCDVAVQGEVNTSSVPHELNYSYTLSVYCGSTLACIEKGAFQGVRQDSAESLEGRFYGTQTWTLDCCTSRQKIPAP